MKYQDISEQFNDIIYLFKQKGCSPKMTKTFIENNLNYLINMGNNILDKIYFICNNNEIYAILIVDNNNYYWSICKDDCFYPLENTDKDEDYIVDMVINFANTDKFKKIVPNLDKMNTEEKVKTLSNIKLNSKGYHLK